MAALDPDSDVTQVDLTTGVDELRRRLEVLLGAHPEAPVDMSQKEEVVAETQQLARSSRERGGGGRRRDVGGRLQFPRRVGGQGYGASRPPKASWRRSAIAWAQCVEEDASGRPRLTVTLPDRSALDSLAQTLARLLLVGGPSGTQSDA